MCLVTSLRKPLVAQTRIKTIKYLDVEYKSNNTTVRYFTPYTMIDVKLGTTLKAAEKKTYALNNMQYIPIEKGYIHSIINPSYRVTGAKAFVVYIPKGTEYFVSTMVNTICSRELEITDEKVDVNKLTEEERNDYIMGVVKDYLAQTDFKEDEVQIDDVVFADMSIKHITEVETFNNIIGIVGLVERGKIKVLALDEFNKEWKIPYVINNTEVMSLQIASYKEAYNDETDDKFFNELVNNKDINIDNYPAFKVCKEYKVADKNWYLPSVGEMYHIVRNSMNAVNVTVTILKKHGVSVEYLKHNDYYWTSVEGSGLNVYTISTDRAEINYWSLKGSSAYVRPVFAIEQA